MLQDLSVLLLHKKATKDMDRKSKKVGKWMPHWVNGSFFNNQNIYGYRCSECNHWHKQDDFPNVCPNCKIELKEPF